MLDATFNDDLEQEAAEIGEIGSERDLPSKIRAMQRQTVPKMPPQPLFGFSGCPSQPARTVPSDSRRQLDHRTLLNRIDIALTNSAYNS